MANTISFRAGLSYTLCAIIWLIYTPICIYCFIQFYKHRNNIVLKKRHSTITIYFLIGGFATLTVFDPLIILLYSNTIFDYDTYDNYMFYPMYLTVTASFYTFIWKQWLYYFDTNFAKATLNKQWTQFLNKKTAENNWFILNKKTFANNSLFHKAIPVLLLIIFITTIIWEFILPTNLTFINFVTLVTVAFWVIFGAVVLSVIRCKTPKMEDSFFIRQELSYFIYISAAMILCVLFNYALGNFVFSNSNYTIASVAINYFILATIITIFGYISTLWVIKKNKLWINIINLNMLEMSTKDEYDTNPKNARNIWTEMNLNKALKSEKIFDRFMQHLIKEFSSEIILSMIEFSQFKNKLYDFAVSVNYFEFDENNEPIDGEWKIKYDFFGNLKTIPKSSIVYDELNENEIGLYANIEHVIHKGEIEFLIRARKLYEKYVQNGCEFELNLSFQQRNILTTNMKEFAKWNEEINDDMNDDRLKILFILFDCGIKEMLTLLDYSFSRFKVQNSSMSFAL
eukprot:125587_1